MGWIPLMVDLSGRKVVIAGGGAVAERRAISLLETNADLLVIAPEISLKLRQLRHEGLITWIQKKFEPADATDAFLIIAATNDPAANEMVIRSAPAHALCNDAGDAQRGNVLFPSHFKRGLLSISISTGGASPMLAAKLKQQLERQYDEQFGEYVQFLHEARQLVKRLAVSPEEKKALLREILADEYLDEQRQRQWIAKLEQALAE